MSNDKKPYFPLFVDLNEKQIVVVGAGTIAKRRIRTLVSFTNISQSLHRKSTGSFWIWRKPGCSGSKEKTTNAKIFMMPIM